MTDVGNTGTTESTGSGFTRIFPLLFLAGAAFALYHAVQGWDGSLMERYAFRQSQTAITVQHMLHGGPLLRYETPIFGPPWSIPLEFPFYQYVVFLLVKLSGYPLEPAGRLVSLLFFVSSLYPLYHLAKTYFADRSAAFIALLLLCISPQYLFWYRSFMIESTALAVSLWYLYFISKQLDRRENSAGSIFPLTMLLVTGAIAAITKVTTFFLYYCIGALLISVTLYQFGRREKLSTVIRKNLPFLTVALVIPLLSIISWTYFTDQVKSLNPLGARFTSAALKTWTYGTLEQKLSLTQWVTAISRSLKDLTGNIWLFAVTFALLPFCRKRTAGVVLLLILLFLLPMAVFSNLYFVHSYYVYANGILLLLALAVVLGDLAAGNAPRQAVSLALLLVICAFSGRYYLQNYYPMQGADYRYQEMKFYIDSFTRPDDVLVFYGADYSSEMPYYLERHSLMFDHRQMTPENYRQSVENLRSYPVGGIVFCLGARDPEGEKHREILHDFSPHFPNGYSVVSFDRCDVYFKARGGNS